MTTTLGPYVTGERPDPLEHTFQDADGAVINLTGFTAYAVMQPAGEAEGVLLDAAILTPLTGVVRVSWPDDGITAAGTTRLEVWVEQVAGVKYASQRFRFYVRAALPLPA